MPSVLETKTFYPLSGDHQFSVGTVMKLLVILALIALITAKPTESIPDTTVSYEAEITCTITSPWCFRFIFYQNDSMHFFSFLSSTRSFRE